MGFLTGLLAQVIEWLLSKGLLAAEGYFAKWKGARDQAALEKAAVAALKDDTAKGDLDAIAKDGLAVLNGTKPPSK